MTVDERRADDGPDVDHRGHRRRARPSGCCASWTPSTTTTTSRTCTPTSTSQRRSSRPTRGEVPPVAGRRVRYDRTHVRPRGRPGPDAVRVRPGGAVRGRGVRGPGSWHASRRRRRLAVERRLPSCRARSPPCSSEYDPTVVVVERVFFQTNAKTATGVAQASGIALACAAGRGCEVAQYTSNEVKLADRRLRRGDQAAGPDDGGTPGRAHRRALGRRRGRPRPRGVPPRGRVAAVAPSRRRRPPMIGSLRGTAREPARRRQRDHRRARRRVPRRRSRRAAARSSSPAPRSSSRSTPTSARTRSCSTAS